MHPMSECIKSTIDKRVAVDVVPMLLLYRIAKKKKNRKKHKTFAIRDALQTATTKCYTYF